MKVPSVGWAFFGLAVVLIVGVLLNKGVFIGSSISPRVLDNGGFYFRKNCNYLFLTGTKVDWHSADNYAEAEEILCPFLFSN